MFPGEKVQIGETEYELPALSLGQLRNGGMELLKQHDALVTEAAANGDGAKLHEAAVLKGKIIHLALKRNYPDIDEDKFLDSLDLANVNRLFLSVIGISGFKLGEVMRAGMTTPPAGT